MLAVISYCYGTDWDSEKDDNAHIVIGVSPEQEECAHALLDPIMEPFSDLGMESLSPNDISIRNLLAVSLKKEGIECVNFQQRLIDSEDNIWNLELITDNFYFYMNRTESDESACFLMFRTDMEGELCSDNYFGSIGYMEELIDISAGKAKVLFMSNFISEMMPEFEVNYAQEIAEAKQDIE